MCLDATVQMEYGRYVSKSDTWIFHLEHATYRGSSIQLLVLKHRFHMFLCFQRRHLPYPNLVELQLEFFTIASSQLCKKHSLDHAFNIFEVRPSQSFWVGQPLLSRCRSSVCRAALDLQLCTWAQGNPCCRDACRAFCHRFFEPRDIGLRNPYVGWH